MDKRIIMIGIGQIGVGISNEFYTNMQSYNCNCSVIAMDTDVTAFNNICGPTIVSMTESSPLSSVVEKMGTAYVNEWFPCDWSADGTQRLGTLEMNYGAGQIRAKGLLSFVYMLSRADLKQKFLSAIDAVLTDVTENTIVELYVAASLAGGTGSALFCAVALYVEKYIREKYNIEAKSKAFLVTPEVLASSHDKDFMERAHANAYAALQELQVINKIALGVADASAFYYRLGQENDPYMGLLFDSTKVEYYDQRFAPFQDVVLLDRVPGIPSLFSYEKLWVDIITLSAIECIEFSPRTGMPDALFHGISSIRYRFDPEKIAKRMAGQRLEEILAKEWIPQIKDLQYLWKIHNPTNSTHHLLNVCRALIDFFIKKDAKKEQTSDNALLSEGNLFLENYVSKELDCTIPETILEKTDEAREAASLLKRFPKKTEKAKMAGQLNDVLSAVTDYYRHCMDAIASITNDDNAGKQLGDGFVKTIMNALCTAEGVEQDPISYFIRLCQFNIEWQTKLQSRPDHVWLTLSSAKLINNTIPPEVFETVYFASFNQSLQSISCLQKKDGGLQIPLSSDAISRQRSEAFCSLCEGVASYLHNMVEGFLIDYLSGYLEERIALLYSFLMRTKQIANVITADNEQIDGYNDGMNRSFLIVGLNEKEYASIYEEYSADETLLSKEIPSLTQSIKQVLISGEVTPSIVLTVWNDWRRDLLEIVRHSPVYPKLKNKNIIESMISTFHPENADCRPVDSVLERLAIPAKPLRHEDIDTSTQHYCVEEKVTLFMSEYSATVLSAGVTDQQTYSGKYIKGDAHIAETELYVVKEVRHLLPGQIVLMNETQDQCGMYRDYLRSLDVADQKETQLRNPYVNRMDLVRGHLPFLNETAQRVSDEQAVQALWYGLTSGSFWAEWNETAQHFVFVARTNGHILDITADNRLIFADEPHRLLLWLRAHPRILQQWAILFERDIQLYRMNIQSQLFQLTDHSFRAIMDCPYIQLIEAGMLDNVHGVNLKQKYYLWQMVQEIAAENERKAIDFVADWRMAFNFICHKMAGNSEHAADVIRTYVLTELRKKWSEQITEKTSINWIADLTNA